MQSSFWLKMYKSFYTPKVAKAPSKETNSQQFFIIINTIQQITDLDLTMIYNIQIH